MPAVLSKGLAARLLGSEWSFGYNCYEVGHTWTPSCTDAALEVSAAAFVRALPLYALLYGFTQVAILKRLDAGASLDTLKSVLRSSAFIFFHLYNGSLVGCALRNGFGRFYYRVLVCIPGLVSSYLALLIERPSRRQALAFYVLNLASEVLYRMAVTKGHFRPLKHGETLLFALSLAAWFHLIKAHGFGRDPVSALVRALLGRHEAAKSARPRARPGDCEQLKVSANNNQNNNQNNNNNNNSNNNQSSKPRLFQYEKVGQLEALLTEWLGGRHASCPHPEATCVWYAARPVASRFLVGCLVQSALKLASNPVALLRSPASAVGRALVSRQSLRFGLFLVTLVSGARATSCLLRRASNSNSVSWHAPLSGLVAGLSMLWAPRANLSMYVMWKAIEQYYLRATNQGRASYFDFSILTIYALSAATLLYTFALEPGLMRPSYMKFLDNLSDHRLHQLNRMVLDVFGTGSSVGYEDYFPDLHPKLMSNQFKELIFNWLIQPYE